MAEPITWRTVMGASLADASRPLEAAQRSINSGISGLASLVSDQQQVAQNAVDRTNEANVQAFLDRIQGAQSVDDVNALKQSGELDALRAALTPKDLARVRGAEDLRTKSLMDQLTSKRNFESAEAAAKAAPIRDQAMSLFLSNNPVKMAQAKQIIEANPQIQWADTLKTMNELQAQAQDRQHRAQLQPLQLEAQKLTIDKAKEEQTNSREDRAARKLQEAAAAEQERIQREQQFLKESGNEYAEGLFTPERSNDLMEFMTKYNIGDDVGERQAVIKRLLDMREGLEVERVKQVVDAKGKPVLKNGQPTFEVVKDRIPLSFARAKQAVLGSQDQLFNWWNQGYADSAEENLRASLRATMPMETQDGRSYMQNKAAFDFDQYMQNRKGAATTGKVVGKPKEK